VTRRVLDGLADKWIKRHAGLFDRVLVDAPCSGSGTWRRNPDAKWRLTDAGLAEQVAAQARILESASRLVRPGGRLLYATCSLLTEENEGQVTAFLAGHGDFHPVSVGERWPAVADGDCPSAADNLRLSPLGAGTDGFFAALFERR